MPDIHGHHRMPCALPGLQCSHLFVASCLWASAFSFWKAALLGSGQVAIEQFPISLPRETLGFLSQIALGHFPFALWSAGQSFLQDLNPSSPEHFTVQASASISCHIISKHQWPGSTSSHTCTCHNIASAMFDSLWYALDHELLLLFYSHRSGASLVSVQRTFFRTEQTVRCFMAVLVCNRGFAPCCKPSCRSHSCVSSGLRGTLHWLLVVRCYTW